jgi:hypothetical protein
MTSSPSATSPASGPEQLKRSIDSLQRLYTFVISLAVTEGLRRFLAPDATPEPWFAYWRELTILLCTIVPFYHGANGHLDQTYLYGFEGTRREKRYALLLDFGVLFAEAILFFALALSLTDSGRFIRIFQLVLAVDVLWAGIVYLTGSHEKNDAAHAAKWGFLNFAFVVILEMIHDTQLLTPASRPDWWLIAALARTGLDYRINWDFYVARYPMMKSVDTDPAA